MKVFKSKVFSLYGTGFIITWVFLTVLVIFSFYILLLHLAKPTEYFKNSIDFGYIIYIVMLGWVYYNVTRTIGTRIFACVVLDKKGITTRFHDKEYFTAWKDIEIISVNKYYTPTLKAYVGSDISIIKNNKKTLYSPVCSNTKGLFDKIAKHIGKDKICFRRKKSKDR